MRDFLTLAAFCLNTLVHRSKRVCEGFLVFSKFNHSPVELFQEWVGVCVWKGSFSSWLQQLNSAPVVSDMMDNWGVLHCGPYRHLWKQVNVELHQKSQLGKYAGLNKINNKIIPMKRKKFLFRFPWKKDDSETVFPWTRHREPQLVLKQVSAPMSVHHLRSNFVYVLILLRPHAHIWLAVLD